MLKASKEFEEARNQRFAEKEKVYGGDDNPYNWQNMTYFHLLDRIKNQLEKIDQVDKDKRKKELVDTANLCDLAWRKLR